MTILATMLSPSNPPAKGFDLSPAMRGIVLAASTILTAMALYAILRAMLGIAPAHPNIRSAAIVLHIVSVIPAIPLGGYLLLSRKGTALHKQLGKLWIAMMVVTALSAIFIRTSGSFSFIHVFVPLTLIGAWQTVRYARQGRIAEHRKQIIGMYLGALMIPGLVAFLLPGRLMNVWTFGWPA